MARRVPNGIKSSAMKLAVKEYGKENTKGDVILLHGTGARAEMWEPQIKILVNDGWHCIVPDLRGHGESHEPEEKTNLEVHLNDVMETLADYPIKWPAIFIGHSLGAIISVELAAMHPEKVERILAVSLPGRVPKATVLAFKAFLNVPYSKLRGTALHNSLAWRERTLLETNQFSLGQIMENFQNLDYVSKLPDVKCPIHFAVGRLDPVAPSQHVETMHKKTPGSTLRIIEWAGHNCMDSQAIEFNNWFRQIMNERTIPQD